MSPSRHAITLVELLCVVVVVVLLILLLMPSLGGRSSPATTRRSVCASNLKVQWSAFAQAGIDNAGKWPASSAALQNLCQQSVQTRDKFVTASASAMGNHPERIFYCVGNTAQNVDTQWTLTGDVSQWGYVWLNDRGTSGTALPATFAPRIPPLQYLTCWDRAKSPSQTALACDVVVTDTPAAPFNFNPKTATIPFGTSHHSTRTFYTNLLFADGHVSALKFNPKTSTPIPQPGGAIFWIPGD